MSTDGSISGSAFPEFSYIPWNLIADETQAVQEFRDTFDRLLGDELTLKFIGTTSPLFEIIDSEGNVVATIDDEGAQGRFVYQDQLWRAQIERAVIQYAIQQEKKSGG